MADNKVVELDISELNKYFTALSDPRMTLSAVKTGMRAGSESLRAKVQENLTRRILNRVTGQLIRSVFVDQPTEEGDGIVVTFGSRGVPYAAIHEFGGTIKHPGGTHYFIKDDGTAVFVRKTIGGSLGLPVTRPHDIKIPARMPFREAAGRSITDFKEQIATYTLKALKDAGKL